MADRAPVTDVAHQDARDFVKTLAAGTALMLFGAVCIVLGAPLAEPARAAAPAQQAPVLVNFDTLSPTNVALTGEYPGGLITWGNNWYLSGPWGPLGTNSVSFSGASVTSATFTFLIPSQVVEFDAYNGGSGASTVTLQCNGAVSRSVPAGAVLHIVTGLTGTCGTVTLTSSNGWNTNFDNLSVAPSGPLPTPTPPPNATTMGSWSSSVELPVVPVALAVLPDGRLLMADEHSQPIVFNPLSLGFTTHPVATDLFCTAFAMLADGRVIAVGGHGTASLGTRDTNIFDPTTETWTPVSSMADARWYPTATQLRDGRILAISGAIRGNVWADVPEIYDPVANTWAGVPVNTSNIQETEYPFTFLLPNGNTVTIGPTNGHLNELVLQPAAWTRRADTPIRNGSAAHYRPGKILMTGGGSELGVTAARTAATIDLSSSTSTSWQTVASMAYGRYNHNLTMLPDGTVMAIGGSPTVDQITNTGVLPTEIWNPDTNVWSVMASVHHPRLYHSTSALLPDGRVVGGGGGSLAPNANYRNVEFFSPPYLFKGPRPTIAATPPSVSYGQAFTLSTPDAGSIAKVSVLPLASVTHTTDMNQRYVELAFTANSGSLTITPPADASVAPGGMYMLFILNGQGVPSEAAVVQLHSPDGPSPTPTPTRTASPLATSTPTPTSTPTVLSTATPPPPPADASVTIAGFAFQPSNVTAQVGDIVRWTNTDAALHTSTSLTGVWNSPQLASGASFDHTFTAPGDYAYRCAIHASMTGTIHVAAPTPTATPTRTPSSTNTPTATPTPTPGTQLTITFNDAPNPGRTLDGQYPTGVISWGTGMWYLSRQWGLFNTNSVSFNAGGSTSRSFVLVTPRRIVSVTAYNGGGSPSTISLACAGNPTRTLAVPARQLATLTTSWTNTCASTVTIGSSNGWDTNFDNLVLL